MKETKPFMSQGADSGAVSEANATIAAVRT